MRSSTIISAITLMSLAMATPGCQSLTRVLHQPEQAVTPHPPEPRVILTVYSQDPPLKPSPGAPTGDSPKTEKSSADDDALKDKPVQADAAAQVKGYTAPGESVRRIVLADTADKLLEDAQSPLRGAGRELSESVSISVGMATSDSLTGLSGLGAPQPVVATTVLSLPGLQQGPAAGLGFSSSFNVLTPQINPLSGPTGRCHDLVNVGFFSNDQAACERHFQPR